MTRSLSSCLLFFLIALLQPIVAYSQQQYGYADYVRPLIGTHGEGNTYPGAVAPFGMIQISPDTEKQLWETASGYDYGDSNILGFSLTHFSGTGIPDLGDILFIPQTGKPDFVPGPKEYPDSGYRSRFSHDDEIASAGYYAVTLKDEHVRVECTVADHSGFLRFTYPAGDSSYVVVDLSHVLRWNVIWSNVRVINDSTITGFHLVNGWAKERYVYFTAVFSRAFDECGILNEGKKVKYDGYRFRSEYESWGKNLQFYARFKTKDQEKILVKVGISAISTKSAAWNMKQEINHWDFEKTWMETKEKWNKELAVIEMDGGQEEKETFYTALYHTFLTPIQYQDVDGWYRGLDQQFHKAEGFTNYAIFSLWDTYRATHPLFCLIQPDRNADMINSMLAHYDQSVEHLLPIWSLCNNETWCMIGYHAIPVIADAYLKGIKGFDAERAYQAMKTTAMNPNYDNVMTYAELGWVPFDKENESVSKTLEYAHDDFCIAQMAKSLGKQEDHAYFMKRAGAYQNLFDPSWQLMRGKDSKGNWRTPFDPHLYVQGGDITEGTSFQYTWSVPHDVEGLIGLFGSKKALAAKLDSLFIFTDNSSDHIDDIQGRIGEYWHGNEPSHHIIFLYDLVGQPWKTQELSRRILKTQYGNKPNSLTGNDDCGQMSAWYLFNAMGFYPVCPGTNYYAIGSPAIREAVIHLKENKTFTIKTEYLSAENVYIQSARLNGRLLDSPFFFYEDIIGGGELHFVMGPKPNTKWGQKVDFKRLNNGL